MSRTQGTVEVGHPERSRIAAVVALSVAVGTGWLLTEAYPSEMVFPFAGFVHFATIAVMGSLISIWLPGVRWNGWRWKRVAGVVAAGLGVFVLPGLVGQLTAGEVSPEASVAMFCAVPLMIVLGMTWFGSGSERGAMMPALVGLGGALLVFSVEVPGSARRAAGLAAVIVGCALVAWASAAIFRLMQGVGVAAAVAVVGIAGATVLGGYGAVTRWPRVTAAMVGVEVLRCVVFDLPVVWATVWLMREVRPIRLAARFLIAPVVTWVEGYAMVRGTVEARSVVALVLMAVGAGTLLGRDETDPVRGLGLRAAPEGLEAGEKQATASTEADSLRE